MIVFNTSQVDMNKVPMDTVFIFPAVLNGAQIEVWIVATKVNAPSMASSLQPASPSVAQNIIGMFPIVDVAVRFARLLEDGTLDAVEIGKITYGETVH